MGHPCIDAAIELDSETPARDEMSSPALRDDAGPARPAVRRGYLGYCGVLMLNACLRYRANRIAKPLEFSDCFGEKRQRSVGEINGCCNAGRHNRAGGKVGGQR